MASFEQWLEAFQQACDLPPARVSEVMCPNCGVQALQLRFVTYHPEWRAIIAFWCGNCLEGIAPGRYLLFCNMAGHFRGGMHRELVVR